MLHAQQKEDSQDLGVCIQLSRACSINYPGCGEGFTITVWATPTSPAFREHLQLSWYCSMFSKNKLIPEEDRCSPDSKFWFRHSTMKCVHKTVGSFNRLCRAVSEAGSLKLYYTTTVTFITAFSPCNHDENWDRMRAKFPQGSQPVQTGKQNHMGKKYSLKHP